MPALFRLMFRQVNLTPIKNERKINLEIKDLFMYFAVQSTFYGRKKSTD